ncbi:hypothetical protein BpHYR1_029152 [Brachionus plicatilis]|uniref:Uncharacterized protein n=1 Tax=Brachionus plicatilis TaxID=10195 RepID=A0A3M7PVC9_BRAPC|nr:hypothetical protein BpHYR1_029152 [Brachionus plicatilis]
MKILASVKALNKDSIDLNLGAKIGGFNASKKRNDDDAKNFKLGELDIPLQKGLIYLGLPLGDLNFINSCIDAKMRDVEKVCSPSIRLAASREL